MCLCRRLVDRLKEKPAFGLAWLEKSLTACPTIVTWGTRASASGLRMRIERQGVGRLLLRRRRRLDGTAGVILSRGTDETFGWDYLESFGDMIRRIDGSSRLKRENLCMSDRLHTICL